MIYANVIREILLEDDYIDALTVFVAALVNMDDTGDKEKQIIYIKKSIKEVLLTETNKNKIKTLNNALKFL